MTITLLPWRHRRVLRRSHLWLVMAEGNSAAATWAVDQSDSVRLTRSSTIYHSLLRIYGSPRNLPSSLVLHIVGADHRCLDVIRKCKDVIRMSHPLIPADLDSGSALALWWIREGNTPEQTRDVFEKLFHHLACYCENVEALHIFLCGPNVAAEQHGAKFDFHLAEYAGASNATENTTSANVSPKQNAGSHVDGNIYMTTGPRRIGDGSKHLKVTLQYNTDLYHNVSVGLKADPDVLFLFNAGLWGYDDWTPTLKQLLVGMTATRPPTWSRLAAVVITSYCAEEAEDDMDTVEQLLTTGGGSGGSHGSADLGEEGSAPMGAVEWLWRPEVNPHRSLVERKSACVDGGRKLFENHSWQAIRPPAVRGRTRTRSG